MLKCPARLAPAVIASHPLISFSVCFVAVLVAERFRSLRSSTAQRPAVWIVAAAVPIAAIGALVLWYAAQPTFFDPAEPTITAVSTVFAAGKPLYPSLDAPERYAHVYGPVLFLAHAAALSAFGFSISASKSVGAIAILTSLAIVLRVYRTAAGGAAAWIVTSIVSALCLDFGNAAFWTRADPLLVLMAALALLAATQRREWAAAGLLGIATGVSLNLKVTGAFYTLPAAMLVWRQLTLRSKTACVATAAATAIAPFLLPNVSAEHYFSYLALAARTGLAAGRVRQNLEWAMIIVLPLAAIAWTRWRRDRAKRNAGIVLAFSILAVSVIGGKAGGGPYHLLPFGPLVGYVIVDSWSTWRAAPFQRALVGALACALVVLAVPRQLTFVRTVRGRDLRSPLVDVREFIGSHPAERIAMGYAGTSRDSDARVEVVFLTREYLLDAPAVQEYQRSGLPLPRSTIETIGQCRYATWLIPPDAAPFDVPSAYSMDGAGRVFSEEFRRLFESRYRKAGRTRYFDIWRCRT